VEGRDLSKQAARKRDSLITTNGEFHTIRRQIDRLEEAGVPVTRVDARPVGTLAERLAARVNDRTACVLVSSVLFETAEIVPAIEAVAEACARDGAVLLVDAYHHLNAVPFDVRALGLDRAFIVGGGYKYCQLGEGNCFMRVPPDCDLRPVLTGWFSEFGALAGARSSHEVRYGARGSRFAGATYDPTSHYRAAAVFRFHAEQQLTAARLREISVDQTSELARAFSALDLDPGSAQLVDVPASRRAGFVAIRTPHAAAAVRLLRDRGVFADSRGDLLRLGPAPYVSGDQLRHGIACLGQALHSLAS
jgi:kynureninase